VSSEFDIKLDKKENWAIAREMVAFAANFALGVCGLVIAIIAFKNIQYYYNLFILLYY
jgi:hypothetical protein